MESEGPFLCSQEPPSGLYPDPDESTPQLPMLFLLRSLAT